MTDDTKPFDATRFGEQLKAALGSAPPDGNAAEADIAAARAALEALLKKQQAQPEQEQPEPSLPDGR